MSVMNVFVHIYYKTQIVVDQGWKRMGNLVEYGNVHNDFTWQIICFF